MVGPIDLSPEAIDSVVNFLGYGNLSAPVWFIGIEEGLGNMSSDEVVRNLRARGTFKEVMDLHEAHCKLHEKGHQIDIEKNPPDTQVWRWMAKIMLARQGCKDWIDSEGAESYVRFHLGRICGHTFMTELSPIPAKSTGDKNWMKWFENHCSNLDEKLRQRRLRLREEIRKNLKENSRTRAVCYGRGSNRANEFAEFFGIKWEPVTPNISRSKDSEHWLLPFFGLGHMSGSVIDELFRTNFFV